jgi:hypothetical protein
MADPRELFPILDDGAGAGAVPHKMEEGDDPSSKNGLIGFSFKDNSGNVVLPQLDSSGRVPVTSEATGTCKDANGELAAGSTSLVDITNAEIDLSLTKLYTKIEAIVSCLHASLFQIVYVDDAEGTPVEEILAECVVGPGHYSFKMGMDCLELDTSGGTGTQKLKIKGKNFIKASSMRATLACLEN